MDLSISFTDLNSNNVQFNLENIKFQKMVFIYNALNDGWTVKKKNETYVFTKKHGNKKELYLEKDLSSFIGNNLNINNLLS
jgi:hypothetical protein